MKYLKIIGDFRQIKFVYQYFNWTSKNAMNKIYMKTPTVFRSSPKLYIQSTTYKKSNKYFAFLFLAIRAAVLKFSAVSLLHQMGIAFMSTQLTSLSRNVQTRFVVWTFAWSFHPLRSFLYQGISILFVLLGMYNFGVSIITKCKCKILNYFKRMMCYSNGKITPQCKFLMHLKSPSKGAFVSKHKHQKQLKYQICQVWKLAEQFRQSTSQNI